MPTDWERDFKILDLEEENIRLRRTIARLKAEKAQYQKALIQAFVGEKKPDDPRT